jgi:Methyltransferase domain
MGRHARALSSRGYSVTGVDRDENVIAIARSLAGGALYMVQDVRDYGPIIGAFNVVIVMAQSLGYFDAATNRDLLHRLAAGLQQGGRVVLDLWNPQFFETHDGERDLPSACGAVRETKQVRNGRLFVELEYPDGAADAFEWQLFSPAQVMALAVSVDLALTVACTDFHMTTEIDPAKPKIQFVLERP